MLLSKLVEPLPMRRVIGSANPEIETIAYDSRSVAPGVLFVCIRGGKFDGHAFIGDAVSRGAAAILVDRPECVPSDVAGVPFIEVPNVRQAMPILANCLYGYPSRHLKLIGVTGTNGKTTTTYLIESMLRHAGVTAGVIGTLGARIDGRAEPTEHTTPESVDLQALLAKMVCGSVSAAAMEVSSHALAQGRSAGCEFDVGVFTNLTQDHLDFHKTLDEYLRVKLMLFGEYPRASAKPFTAVVNADDPHGQAVADATVGRVITYGVREDADVLATDVNARPSGVSFHATSPVGEFDVSLKLGGFFNVYNSLAAIGAAVALGLSRDEIVAGLQAVPPVAGRFEAVDCGQDFSVIVDYAHTPDGLQNVLQSARKLTSGKLIAVFGCGGDRDRGKRPQMGRIGTDMADLCIVTSDNPRSEDPGRIVQDILAGIDQARMGDVQIVLDRRDAIKQALDAASSGDLVVVAGKGHEDYQIFKDRTIHFDDRQVVRELLGCNGKRNS